MTPPTPLDGAMIGTGPEVTPFAPRGAPLVFELDNAIPLPPPALLAVVDTLLPPGAIDRRGLGLLVRETEVLLWFDTAEDLVADEGFGRAGLAVEDALALLVLRPASPFDRLVALLVSPAMLRFSSPALDFLNVFQSHSEPRAPNHFALHPAPAPSTASLGSSCCLKRSQFA